MNVTQGIEQVLALLKQVDRIGIPITWAEWRALFVRALETVRIPVAGQCPVGVQVIDAMAARGHAFHILFLLGMNEQVFPRVVREDAFLRDSDRRVLAESLGYKIDEKMNGFDEEALLFTLLRQSARDRVYLLYQRADHKGRLLLPSSLLLESREQSEACSAPEISVPLRMADCVTLPSYSARGETLQEMRVHYLLQGQEIHADPSERSGWWEILHSGLKAIASLERRFLSAGPFDGIVPGEGPHWRELMSRGLSPTALEQYVQCPFKYWMEQVLGTRNDREPLSRELPNRVWGELGHAIFRRVYQNLIDEGWPVLRLEPVPLSSFLNSAIEQVADEYAMRYGKGYVLLWERIKLQFLRVLMAMVEHDQQEYEALGMRPVAFEIEAEGEIPSGVPGTSPGIKIRGRLDRVDRQVKESRTRIVDYKFSAGLALGTAEPDLLNDALQGRRLQPPFYSFLSCPSPASDSGEEALAHPSIQSIEFRYIRPLNGDALGFSSFASAHWETSAGNQLLSTIHRWIQGLRGGQFFVLPGSYCRGCHWSVACRVQHHPSWMRAYALPLAKDFRQLRKQRKTDE